MLTDLKHKIEQMWNTKSDLSHSQTHHKFINSVIDLLDQGQIRVAEYIDENWHTHQWIKKAILLSFKINQNFISDHHGPAYDKVPLKFAPWNKEKFQQHNIRVVPGSVVRQGAYVGENTILMPSFINIGAYVGHSTMIDTWATVGSCVQVGDHCHISGGTGLGGVLEPLQANPVIIENNCFIGARSEIVEGVIVKTGAVIGMGVFIGSNTPIFDQQNGKIYYGEVPAYSVVIAGSLPSKRASKNGVTPHLNCAVIIKTVDEKTRAKTALNELLRV